MGEKKAIGASRRLAIAGSLICATFVASAVSASPRRCLTLGRRAHFVPGFHLFRAQPPSRPRAEVTVASSRGFPFLVHGPAGSSALVARIRDAADRAWQAEIAEGGWPAPPQDRGGPDSAFDIYIDPSLGPGEGYTQPEDDVPATPFDDSTSYIGLPGSFSSDAEIFSVVAHELNHASQFAIDALESDAFFEQTAVLVEQRVAHVVATYGVGIADFQAHPERALDYINSRGDDTYEYGAALWLMFLVEKLGDGSDAIVRRLWEGSKQAAPDGATNEPDFLDALGTVLAEKGWTKARLFAEFASWRYFTGERDDGRHFADGALWGPESLVVAGERALPAMDASLVVRAQLAAYGASLTVVSLPAGAGALDVALRGEAPGAAVVPLDVAAPGRAAVLVEGATVAHVALPPGTTRVLVALTFAPADHDPDAKDWRAREVSVEISAAAPFGTQVADGGSTPSRPPLVPAGDAEPAIGGGGCAVGGDGGADVSPVPFVSLVLLCLARLAARYRKPRHSP